MNNKVIKFAEIMQRELKNNENKGNWEDFQDQNNILIELDYHLDKLKNSTYIEQIEEHIADCANILMFLGNSYGLYDNINNKVNINLQDRFGKNFYRGCIVENLTQIRGLKKGTKFKCIFNQPQFRYGFGLLSNEKEIEDPNNLQDCRFYLTPRNAKNLKIIEINE